MKREYKLYLIDIRNNVDKIHEFIIGMDFNDFIKDEKTIYAVLRSLEIIGEAVSMVPVEIKEKYSEVPWKDIKNFRNLVVHKYWDNDTELIWDIIVNHINPLKDMVNKILKQEK